MRRAVSSSSSRMQAFVESSQSSGGTTQAPEGSSDAGVYPLPEVPLNFQVTGRSQLLEVPNVAIAVVEIPGKAKRRYATVHLLLRRLLPLCLMLLQGCFPAALYACCL